MSGFAIYTSPSDSVEVRLEKDTVWLRREQMAELYGRDRTVIGRHIRNVFAEAELDEESNVQNLHIAGSDKPVGFYNLDVIISVGYRVKSQQGTRFRQWATGLLRQHRTQGYRSLSYVGRHRYRAHSDRRHLPCRRQSIRCAATIPAKAIRESAPSNRRVFLCLSGLHAGAAT